MSGKGGNVGWGVPGCKWSQLLRFGALRAGHPLLEQERGNPRREAWTGPKGWFEAGSGRQDAAEEGRGLGRELSGALVKSGSCLSGPARLAWPSLQLGV